VINQPEKVSESLRIQVQKAIDSLGYIPNQHASSLASSKSRVIGVAIPSLSNIVFTEVLRGIYEVMGAAGYKVLLVDTHYSPLEEEKMVRTLLRIDHYRWRSDKGLPELPAQGAYPDCADHGIACRSYRYECRFCPWSRRF
jgi:hypothetical protein